MRRLRQASRPTLVLILACLALAGLAGCSRQSAVSQSTATAGSAQLPFDRLSDSNGVSPTEAFAFDGLPAGTEFAIRLRSPLSSANSRVGDSFQAVLDDSVVIAGKTVAPRGAPATGSVVDARSSAGHDPGYLRMTLTSIVLNGRSIPLQTSSIFTKDSSYEKPTAEPVNSLQAGKDAVPAPTPGDVRFSTGHRFTFRLIQALHL